MKNPIAFMISASASGTGSTAHQPAGPPPAVRVGVARDESFCFYYPDNLELLKDAGIELVFFSPLHETALPGNLDGLYLGGGFPEEFAANSFFHALFGSNPDVVQHFYRPLASAGTQE